MLNKIKPCLECNKDFVSETEVCFKCRNGISEYEDYLLKFKKPSKPKEIPIDIVRHRVKVLTQLKKDGFLPNSYRLSTD